MFLNKDEMMCGKIETFCGLVRIDSMAKHVKASKKPKLFTKISE